MSADPHADARYVYFLDDDQFEEEGRPGFRRRVVTGTNLELWFWRIKGGTDIIGHKPSTRHDVELGRPMEIDPLVSSVQELARRLAVPTPTLDAVATLLRLQGQVLGLYERKPALEAAIQS